MTPVSSSNPPVAGPVIRTSAAMPIARLPPSKVHVRRGVTDDTMTHSAAERKIRGIPVRSRGVVEQTNALEISGERLVIRSERRLRRRNLLGGGSEGGRSPPPRFIGNEPS